MIMKSDDTDHAVWVPIDVRPAGQRQRRADQGQSCLTALQFVGTRPIRTPGVVQPAWMSTMA